MNGFYLAKKNLKYSGYLDFVFIVAWSILLFVVSINRSISEKVDESKNYSEIFNKNILDTVVFTISVWHVVLFLFSVILISFIGKVILGSISFYWFIKSKSLMHVYATVSVIFLPLVGGIVAINTYRATTNSLAPRYISPYSQLRSRIRDSIRSWLSNADN